MDYFILNQNAKLKNVPKLTLLEQATDAKNENLLTNPHLEQTLMLQASSSPVNEYPSLFETPLMLVANDFKKILSQYQQNLEFQMALLVETNREHQAVYQLIKAPFVNCLANENDHETSQNLHKLTLDASAIGTNRIFRVTGYPQKLIVRLDVAESLLRRDFIGVEFEPVKLKGAGKNGKS